MSIYMLCQCSVPAKACRTKNNAICYRCGYSPKRCDMVANTPAWDLRVQFPAAPVVRFVGLELALHPKTKVESFIARPLDPTDRGVRQLLDDSQRFPGVQTSTSGAEWIFPQAHYEAFVQAMERLVPPAPFVAVPYYVMDCLRRIELRMKSLATEAAQPSPAPSPQELADTPEWAKEKRSVVLPFNEQDPLLAPLRSFQRRGVQFVLEHGGRALIADEMGLGKTVQAIMSAHHYRAEWPVLVICPTSLCANWAHEFTKWLKLPPALVAVVRAPSSRKKDDLPVDLDLAQVVIVGYQNLKRLPVGIIFKVVIIDESHYIKTPESQRCKDVHQVSAKALRVILLSGTPAMSRPAELYSQITLIDQKCLMNHRQFCARYCAGYFSQFGLNATGHSNTHELNRLLKHYVIRRTKAEVLSEIPAKLRRILFMDITPKEKAMLSTHVAGLRQSTSRDGLKTTFSPSMLDLKVQTAKAKIPAVREYLQDAFTELAEAHAGTGPEAPPPSQSSGSPPPPAKVIVFAHHLSMIQAIVEVAEKALLKHGLEYVRITGDTAQQAREVMCDRFRKVPQCCLAVLSMQAMGTGHNLTCASKVVFTELDWNPATHLQCEDRVHRIGQKQECVIEYLLTDGTADEVVWPLLQEKLDVTHAVLANSEAEGVTLAGAAQDRELVKRRDVEQSSGGGSNSGGPTTLDQWIQRKVDPSEGGAALAGAANTSAGTSPSTAAAPAAIGTRRSPSPDVEFVDPTPLPPAPAGMPRPNHSGALLPLPPTAARNGPPPGAGAKRQTTLVPPPVVPMQPVRAPQCPSTPTPLVAPPARSTLPSPSPSVSASASFRGTPLSSVAASPSLQAPSQAAPSFARPARTLLGGSSPPPLEAPSPQPHGGGAVMPRSAGPQRTLLGDKRARSPTAL